MSESTSNETMKEITDSGQVMREKFTVLDAMTYQDDPRTSAELAFALDLNRYHVASRLSDMLKLAYVEKTDRRKCLISDRNCVVWGITPIGERVINMHIDMLASV